MGSSGLRGTPRLILCLEGLAHSPGVSEKLGGLLQSVPARLHGNAPSSRKDHRCAHRLPAPPTHPSSPRQHAPQRLTKNAQRASRGPPAGCLPGNAGSPALDASVDSCSASARLSTMVLGLAGFPESRSSPPETATQPRKPSVKWDLGSDYREGTEETTASGSNFRRERLDSQPDLGLHNQPQIYFLRPRSPLPKLLFRCGSGVQSSCQTRDPPKGIRTFRLTLLQPCPPTPSPPLMFLRSQQYRIFQT